MISNLPENSLYNIFNFKKVAGNGRYRFLRISGKFQYEVDYQKGKLQNYRYMQAKSNGKIAADDDPDGCTDWYDVTYFIDPVTAEATIINEIYIGTTCAPGCSLTDPDVAQVELCGDSGGAPDVGPDPNNTVGVINTPTTHSFTPVQTQFTWTVFEDDFQEYMISSTETFNGMLDITDGSQSFFTTITHNGSVLTDNLIGVSWTENTDIDSPQGQFAYCEVDGTFNDPFGGGPVNTPISGNQTFPYSLIFP